MRHETLHFSCNACELGTGPVENRDLADDDTQLPLGWAEIVIRRKVANPGRALEEQAKLAAIEEYTAALKQAADEPGKQWTLPEVAQLRTAAEAHINMGWEASEPEVVIEETEGQLCMEHVSLLGDLGFEEFAPVVVPAPVPAPVPVVPVVPPVGVVGAVGTMSQAAVDLANKAPLPPLPPPAPSPVVPEPKPPEAPKEPTVAPGSTPEPPPTAETSSPLPGTGQLPPLDLDGVGTTAGEVTPVEPSDGGDQ